MTIDKLLLEHLGTERVRAVVFEISADMYRVRVLPRTGDATVFQSAEKTMLAMGLAKAIAPHRREIVAESDVKSEPSTSQVKTVTRRILSP